MSHGVLSGITGIWLLTFAALTFDITGSFIVLGFFSSPPPDPEFSKNEVSTFPIFLSRRISFSSLSLLPVLSLCSLSSSLLTLDTVPSLGLIGLCRLDGSSRFFQGTFTNSVLLYSKLFTVEGQYWKKRFLNGHWTQHVLFAITNYGLRPRGTRPQQKPLQPTKTFKKEEKNCPPGKAMTFKKAYLKWFR